MSNTAFHIKQKQLRQNCFIPTLKNMLFQNVAFDVLDAERNF